MAHARSPPRIWAYVLYNDGGAPLWHQRRILGRAASASSENELFIVTPDGDVYQEKYDDNDDVCAVRFADARWPPPPGVPRGNVYRFARDPTGAELMAAEDAARTEAERSWMGRERLAGRPEVLPADGVLVVPGAGALVAAAGARAADARVAPAAAAGGDGAPGATGAVGPVAPGLWVTAEDVEGVKIHTDWSPPAASAEVMGRALVSHAGKSLLLMRVTAEEVAKLRSEVVAPRVATGGSGSDADDDLRTLAVRWDRMNERHRSWESVVEHISESSFTDWPLQGPRTAVWLSRHIKLNGGSPTAYYTRVLRDMKMGENDRSAHELEVLLNMLELAGVVDQLNIGNLSCMELCCRRIQLILDANSGSGAPVWEGAEHFMGLGRRARGIAPGLQSHVAARLKDEAEVDKQREKARESRKLRDKGSGGGKT